MAIDPQILAVWLVIGAVAGWLAGQIMKGSGFGVLGNIAVGIVGAIVAGYLFRGWQPFGNWMVNSIVTAAIGAVIVLFVISLIKRA